MQTFVLAQAVVEHAGLSSVASAISDGSYELRLLISEMTVTQMVVGVGLVVLLLFWWRR